MPPPKFVSEMKTNDNLESLLEAISAGSYEKIAGAKPNDILTVYHGTSLSRIQELINGFDATQVRGRDYGGPRHRGLFVTPDFEVAKKFGDGTILELKVYAKFIHGTDYSGVTGREERKLKGDDALDWVKNKFPNSFRPWMSFGMLEPSNEPQGLLIGVVKPAQITRVWTFDRKENKYTEHTREEFLKSGISYNASYRGGKTEYEYVHDAGVDLSDPQLKLNDFIHALAEYEQGEPEKYLKMFKFYAENLPERMKEKLENIAIGGSKLGPLAVKNISKELLALVSVNEATASLEPLLEYLLFEARTNTDKTLEGVLED